MTMKIQDNAPPPHPFLMPRSDYPICHFNASQSDITEFEYDPADRKVGADQMQFLPGGMGNGGHAHRIYPDGREAYFASGSARIAKFQMVDDRLEMINEIEISADEHLSEKRIMRLVERLDDAGIKDKPFVAISQGIANQTGYSKETLPSGMYTVMDCDGFFYAGYGTVVYKIGDVRKGEADSRIRIIKEFDVKEHLPEDLAGDVTRFFGINMTYDGYLIVALSGVVCVLDRDLEVDSFAYASTEGEAIDNGVVVDPDGGVFVVTEDNMRKMVSIGGSLSKREEDGAWVEPYTSRQKPGSLSRGSGTTPTLMGYGPDADRLVLIADQAHAVKLVAFWRDEIPEGSQRTAGSIRVDFDVNTTIEWSPHVHDYGVMVFNSEFLDPVYFEDGEMDMLSTMLTVGQTREAPKGVQRFEWNPNKREFESKWCNEDLSLAWTLSPISTKERVVYLNTVDKGLYELVGLDWDSGEQVGKITLGRSVIFNTGGTLISPRPDGSLYIHGFFGPIRIKDVVGVSPRKEA